MKRRGTNNRKCKTFCVGGQPRCGTSMMMNCMGLGGLELVYDPELEKYYTHTFPREINPYYYEVSASKPLTANLKGKCVKLFAHYPLALPVECFPIKVCYMIRDSAAQYKSYMQFDKAIRYSYNRGIDIACLASNPRVDLSIVWYEDVVERPLEVFTSLRDEWGWPIDAEKAASGVKPELKHF